MSEKQKDNNIQQQKRLISLDAFRGLTIAGMIVVNSPGIRDHIYPPLRHADWHGLTATDLVFPFFLFIMGVSVVLGYSKQLAAERSLGDAFPKILKRTIILFALGVLLNAVSNIENLRIVGVLQRIGLVFFACSIIYMTTSWKTQLWLTVGLLLAYWLSMSFIPFPGAAAGTLEPGINFAAWIDSYLVPGRMYRETWDPEGFYSTLPAIASGLTGVLAGHLIISNLSIDRKLAWLFSLGAVAFALGSVWGWFFPINKNLWTSSYVLYTSGLATISLATSIFFIDVLDIHRGTRPWIIFGANSITVYVLHGLLKKPLYYIPVTGGENSRSFHILVNDGIMAIGFSPEFTSMLWSVLYTGLCFIPIWIMYRKKIFIKI